MVASFKDLKGADDMRINHSVYGMLWRARPETLDHVGVDRCLVLPLANVSPWVHGMISLHRY